MSRVEHVGQAVSAASAEIVEAYFARVHGALLRAKVGECAETVDDLRRHVYEQLSDTAGEPADVERILGEFGTPERLAESCADMALDIPDAERNTGEGRSLLAGRLLGVPYDLRPPTGDRVASRWWDPSNPHLLVPRVWGAGWDLNFGALAVRLGLIRPDDEDVPFGEVPARWMALAWIAPTVLLVAFAVLVVLFQASLPAQVPIHYSIDGVPNQYGSKGDALLPPAIFMGAGMVICLASWVRRRSALSRAASGALALFLGSIALGVYAQHVLYAYGIGPIALFAGIAGCFVLPFLLLVTLSRIGRAAEMRRDLEKKGD